MMRRRRCVVCGELFMPDPRVGKRQHACGAVACQRERHRRNCRDWRASERPKLEDERLRARLGTADGELRLAVVRDECSAKVAIVLAELLRLVLAAPRDEWSPKCLDLRREVLRFTPRSARDETDRCGPAP